MSQREKPGTVIWLTGLSGSGKTTLAFRLKKEFEAQKISIEVLDGDMVRDFFENDLGYSRKERILNVKRIAFAAMLMARHGTHVIVANIAPYYEVRDFIRRHLKNYLQIYVKALPETLRKRDVKGHYRRFEQGQIRDMVGIDDDYDQPRRPDLILDTDCETIDQSLARLVDFCRQKGALT
ncbi:MAG: adenylyl-sulfate kinase [Deltaproteobacteria bacterium]|nr:adenylyl-sulfate kinase [Deltaproteobacteria bacterium]